MPYAPSVSECEKTRHTSAARATARRRVSPVLRRVLEGAAALACVALAACGSAPREPGQAATEFVKAVNSKNVAAMVSQAATPFHFRQQPSATASNDSTTAATERVAPTPYELSRLMQEVVKVKIAGATPDANAPAKADLLRDVLKDTPEVWGGLNLFVFRRDANDPKSVAIVGVDGKGKIQAVYVS
jgi:hypothetical protein